ncbi:beta-ketoacyl synthase chain length factor [Halomonas sp. M4R1S46]|uniref:beta-ketoacyl synthase chain length factor n=1 Tax=Halomonas sp. M4R1S46 TaxID=2982692 RepID=UPI0021E45FD3|nr:beta-ketoacyl synthase chain length factor [Halomonas sp. M4R1S46]UYG06893.1 beta-ketoacyl synthase chain length factor [Halomonas sp. M4R1S46]
MTPPPLTLEEWRAWWPGQARPDEPRLSGEAHPAGKAVPAMLRRRLNLPGRAVSDMLDALDPEASRVLVHASRHGDGERTLQMLEALTDGQPVSPTRFGLSVHNAILGVHSIASGNRRPQQALAASGAELAALFSEARGYLAAGERSVVVVFSDVPVPERFRGAGTAEVELAAVAMRLGTATGRVITPEPLTAAAPCRAPQPTDVIRWLLGEAPLCCPGRRLSWRLAP